MPSKATLEFLKENGIADEPTAEEQKTQPNELFEMLLNAKNLTEEKIKLIKKILTDTNPYNADGTGKLNPVNLARYLKDKGITVRYDDILHDLEITGFKNEKHTAKRQLLPADKI